MLKKGRKENTHNTHNLSTRKRICQTNIYKYTKIFFNFLFLLKKIEDSFAKLEKYINEKKP